MSKLNLRATEGQRLISFRLSDLPDHIRQAGVDSFTRAELKHGSQWDALERVSEIAHAAVYPSDRVYWISAEAYETVMKRKRIASAQLVRAEQLEAA